MTVLLIGTDDVSATNKLPTLDLPGQELVVMSYLLAVSLLAQWPTDCDVSLPELQLPTLTRHSPELLELLSCWSVGRSLSARGLPTSGPFSSGRPSLAALPDA